MVTHQNLKNAWGSEDGCNLKKIGCFCYIFFLIQRLVSLDLVLDRDMVFFKDFKDIVINSDCDGDNNDDEKDDDMDMDNDKATTMTRVS